MSLWEKDEDVIAIKAVTALIPNAGAMTSIALEATVGTANTRLGDPSAHSLKSMTAKLGDDTETIKVRLDRINNALIHAEKSYPTLADGVTCAKDNAKWVLGPIIEIIPINTIASDFYIIGCEKYYIITQRSDLSVTKLTASRKRADRKRGKDQVSILRFFYLI